MDSTLKSSERQIEYLSLKELYYRVIAMLYWSGWIANEVSEGGFDAFILANFEDKSGCRIVDLLEFVKMFWRT